MADLTKEEFILLANHAGLTPEDKHFEELFTDVVVMLDRLRLLGKVDTSGHEPGRTVVQYD